MINCSLGDIAEDIKTGKTPSTKYPEYFNGDIDWFTPGDFNEEKYLNSSQRKISRLSLKDNQSILFEANTVLITCIGDIGKVGITRNSCSSNQQVTGVKTKDIVDAGYLYYWVKYHKKLLENFSNNAVVPILNSTRLQEIPFYYPQDVNFQRKLVEVLDKASSLIQKRKETIKLADEFLCSTFLEMFGDPVMNKSKQPIKKLGDCASLSMGGTPSTKVFEYYGGNIYWMKSGDIKGDFIYSVTNTITELGLKNSNTKLYPIDSVVIALNGQGKTRGNTAVLKVETASNQSVANIECIKEELNPIYLHYQLKLRYQEIRNITGDSDRSGLNLTILRNLTIGVPDINSQNKFAEIVVKTEQLRQKYQTSLTEMENQFNSLMQKAFRGEL